MSERHEWVVNLNPEKPHVIHHWPGEVCNTDQADKKVYLDRQEIDELLDSGAAVACEHCLPEGVLDD